jgi:hypothetical protein
VTRMHTAAVTSLKLRNVARGTIMRVDSRIMDSRIINWIAVQTAPQWCCIELQCRA